MLVSECIDRINTALGTVDDLTGKSANSLFTNKRIVEQLKNALDQYASIAQGIEDIYSTPVNAKEKNVVGPNDAIRSQAYRFLYVWQGGRKYPLNMKPLNYVHTEFPDNSYSGTPRFVSVWNNTISLYPTISSSAQTTTTTGSISDTADTISVVSTDSFPTIDGRFTIGDEKIKYKTKTATTFIGCTRGIENTTASSHNQGVTITHNNFVTNYRKKHFVISVDSSDNISSTDLNKEMEVPDEHIEPIVDMVAYKLLSKIDAERAAPYKIDASAFLRNAKMEIESGYTDVVQGCNIEGAFDWEIDNVVVTL
tara:strand:- start:113 stop:1042 length:930 start_codon:yes stop_codon:yes gene_type:complete